MSQEYKTFAHPPGAILDDVYTPQKEILDGWYAKQKWIKGII